LIRNFREALFVALKGPLGKCAGFSQGDPGCARDEDSREKALMAELLAESAKDAPKNKD